LPPILSSCFPAPDDRRHTRIVRRVGALQRSGRDDLDSACFLRRIRPERPLNRTIWTLRSTAVMLRRGSDIAAEGSQRMDRPRRDPVPTSQDVRATHGKMAVAAGPADEDEFAEIKSAVLAKLTLSVGKDPAAATDRDWFVAAALTVRDRIIHHWLATERASRGKGRKRVYYLSLEFLIGRLFNDVLGNLGLGEVVNAALRDLGGDLVRLRGAEPDAALGNGGLGRLAACFMESMASLSIPAYGYGIRYDHGLFRQVIRDGWQQEYPEEWLSFGNPWEFERPEV